MRGFITTLPLVVILLMAGCSAQEEPAKQVLSPVIYEEEGYAGKVSTRILSGIAQPD